MLSVDPRGLPRWFSPQTARNPEATSMRTADVKAIAGTAFTTMCLVLAGALVLGPVGAEDPAKPDGALVRRPFSVGDTTFIIELDEATLGPGQVPAARLVVRHGGSRPLACEATVRVTATRPTSEMSRMVALPAELAAVTCPLALAAGETKTVPLAIDKPLPAGQVVAFMLTVGDRGGVLATFTTPATPAGK